MRAVIAVDGSEPARQAALEAARLLASDDIRLVAVVEPPVAATAGMESGFAGGVGDPVVIDALWKEGTAAAEEALRDVESDLRATLEPDRTLTAVVHRGDPGPALCELAQELAADVLAIGSRGHGAIRSALLGSVSAFVVRHAPCPVLVVRSGAATGT